MSSKTKNKKKQKNEEQLNEKEALGIMRDVESAELMLEQFLQIMDELDEES